MCIRGIKSSHTLPRKPPPGGAIPIYSSRNVTQHKPLKWVTKKKYRKKNIEVTGIELTCEKKKIIIIALYRPPSGRIH
jgi:hypothetical protein